MVILNCVAGPSRLPILTSITCTLRLRPFSNSVVRQSGHNRWSKIKHKKGAVDAQRSALFSRLTNEIHQSIRSPAGSTDPGSNPRLAAALAKARDGGVPKSALENILARAKAVADGTGQTVMYEAVAAGGKAGLIIECLTDNPTRTVSRVKELLNKYSGRMAPTSYLFERKGLITLGPSESNPSPTIESLLDISLDHGVEDVRETTPPEAPEAPGSEKSEKTFELVTPLGELSAIATLFSTPPISDDWNVRSSDMSYEPTAPVEVVENEGEEGITEEKAETLDKLVDALEAEPDVSQVWTNLSP